MALSLVTPPALEPVTLADAKRQLRIEHDADDALITTLIQSAREHAETFTRRAFLLQTWDLKLDGFPSSVIELPIAPVTSVTSITYVDLHGLTQTWDSSQYRTDLPSGPKAQRGRITLASGCLYPSTDDVTNAVTVRFVAGYGSVAATVPTSLMLGMLQLITHWYENRSSVDAGVFVPVPYTVDALLWPYRTY